MKYCPNCGVKIEGIKEFCPYCGYLLQERKEVQLTEDLRKRIEFLEKQVVMAKNAQIKKLTDEISELKQQLKRQEIQQAKIRSVEKKREEVKIVKGGGCCITCLSCLGFIIFIFILFIIF